MKILDNKTTKIAIDKDSLAKYSDLLFFVFNKPLEEGVTLSDMRKYLRVMKSIEDAKTSDTIDFNDEDYSLVASKVELSVWGVISTDIIEFSDYIQSFK